MSTTSTKTAPIWTQPRNPEGKDSHGRSWNDHLMPPTRWFTPPIPTGCRDVTRLV
jgi:hypothetical protein